MSTFFFFSWSYPERYVCRSCTVQLLMRNANQVQKTKTLRILYNSQLKHEIMTSYKHEAYFDRVARWYSGKPHSSRVSGLILRLGYWPSVHVGSLVPSHVRKTCWYCRCIGYAKLPLLRNWSASHPECSCFTPRVLRIGSGSLDTLTCMKYCFNLAPVRLARLLSGLESDLKPDGLHHFLVRFFPLKQTMD